MNRIPVVSLWQPWASWVALGWKTIETRTHARFANLQGRLIAIHAAMKWDDTAFRQAQPFAGDLQLDQIGPRVHGAIIAIAYVDRAQWLSGLEPSRKALIECMNGPRFGLCLRDIRRVEPYPCKGRQGVWYVDQDLLK